MTELTPEQRHMIRERGIAAEFLLTHSLFNEAIKVLATQYSDDLFTTHPKEREKRESIYAHHNALQDLVNLLGQWVRVKDSLDEEEILDRTEQEGMTTNGD